MSHSDLPNLQEQTSIPIGAPGHASQVTMEQFSTTAIAATSPAAQSGELVKDVIMTDGTPDRPASPAIALNATNAPSPLPARTGTPSRNVNGSDVTSRANSQHPDPAPTMPREAPDHGAPTRQYLNSKITGVLLEGVKLVAKEQPKDPLRALGEYFLQRSKEIEGT